MNTKKIQHPFPILHLFLIEYANILNELYCLKNIHWFQNRQHLDDYKFLCYRNVFTTANIFANINKLLKIFQTRRNLQLYSHFFCIPFIIMWEPIARMERNIVAIDAIFPQNINTNSESIWLHWTIVANGNRTISSYSFSRSTGTHNYPTS